MKTIGVFLLVLLMVAGQWESCQGASPYAPFQIHLSFGNEPTTMVVMWATKNQSSYPPTAQFGLSASSLTGSATGSYSSFYSTTEFRYTSTVAMSGLQPDSLYFYRVGTEDPAGSWSDVYSFSSPPASLRPFTVAVYGDMGTYYGNDTRAALTQAVDQYEWVFHLGDIAYSDDIPTRDYSSNFDLFFDEIQPYAALKAYQVLPGNHDADCHTTGAVGCDPSFDNFTVYRTRWSMPNTPAQNMWYAFNYSYAQFVSISSETDFPYAPEGLDTLYRCGPFGNQLQWLEQQLQQAALARGERPWLIVTGHRPMYAADFDDFPPDAMKHLRAAMEDLFIKYKVDVYLSGHVHGYERLYPIANGKVMNQTGYNNPPAPTYIIIGNAGNIEGHATTLATNGPLSPYVAAWNAEDYGYAVLTLSQTAFSWTAYTTTGAIIDNFTLTKS